MDKKKLVIITLLLLAIIVSLCSFFLIRNGKNGSVNTNDPLFSKTFPDRSYYTTESELKLICLANIDSTSPDKTPNTIHVSIQDDQESELFKTSVACQGIRTLIPIKIKDFAPGTYSAVTQFQDSNGKTIWENSCKFKKLPPAPSTEVKLDYDNETILIDGKPFFPIGYLIMGRVWSKEMIKKMSAAGFNCLVRWEYMEGNRPIESLPEITESLDRAQAGGIKVFEAPFAFGPDFYPVRSAGALSSNKGDTIRQAMLNSIRLPMKIWKKHPAVIGYYGLDEPEEDLFFFTRQIYDSLKDQDPYRLVYSTNWQPWSEKFYEAYDVLGMQTYWMPLANTYQNSTPEAEVSKPSARMKMLAERFHRPFIGTPQACWREEVRKITPQEMRCSYYLPIIHGAKGLLIFWYNEEEMHSAEWKASTEIAREINLLVPVLLKKSPPQVIVSSLSNRSENTPVPNLNDPIGLPADFKPFDNAQAPNVAVPMIHSLAKSIPNGEIILVANSDSKPYRAVFNLSTIGKGTKIEDFFNSSKSYKLTGTTFTDSLEGYAVRVYKVNKSSRVHDDEPVRMSISVQLEKGVSEQKNVASSPNLLLNGSFEEATYFGKPDAWFINSWTDTSAVITPIDQRQVEINAVDGKYAGRSGWWGGWKKRAFFQVGKVDLSQDYVFSIYLKADRPNVPFILRFEKPLSHTWRGEETPEFYGSVIIGTEWRRYILPIPLKQKGLQGESVFQVSVEANGICNVWADAAQLEAGLTPTPFKRDTYRATPLGDSYSRKAILGKE